MSLSARFAVGASRTAACAAIVVACTGVAMAGTTVVARALPSSGLVFLVAVGGSLALLALLFVHLRLPPRVELVLSADREIEVVDPVTGSALRCELDERSTVWPGLAWLTFVPREGGRAGVQRSFCVADADLAAKDARSLHRFLTWQSRGGGRPDLLDDRLSR